MLKKLFRKFLEYVYGNYVGNFLGFAIGMASSRLVSRFFTTRSIHNLWGLTAHKQIVSKHTYTTMEWIVSIVVGFIVFEIISKWLTKKLNELMLKSKYTQWLVEEKEKEKEKEAVVS